MLGNWATFGWTIVRGSARRGPPNLRPGLFLKLTGPDPARLVQGSSHCWVFKMHRLHYFLFKIKRNLARNLLDAEAHILLGGWINLPIVRAQHFVKVTAEHINNTWHFSIRPTDRRVAYWRYFKITIQLNPVELVVLAVCSVDVLIMLTVWSRVMCALKQWTKTRNARVTYIPITQIFISVPETYNRKTRKKHRIVLSGLRESTFSLKL